MITKAKVYKEILDYGSKFFEPRPDLQVVKNVHTRNSIKGFGEAIDPVEISFKLADNLLGLEALLQTFMGGTDKKLISHDITEMFYIKEMKKNKEVDKYVASNRSAVKGDITFEHDGGIKTRAVSLTYGIDLPSQTTLRSVVNFNPKVFVIHWPENDIQRRYATVLQTDIGIGLWCGIYSNIAFLVNLR